MEEKKSRFWLWTLIAIVVVVAPVVYIQRGGVSTDNIVRTVQRMKKPGSDDTFRKLWGNYLQDAEWSRQDVQGQTYVSVSGVMMYDGAAAKTVIRYKVDIQTVDGEDYVVATAHQLVVNGEPKSMFELTVLLLGVFGE